MNTAQATTTEMLQALATLNPAMHLVRRADVSDIEHYLHLAGKHMDVTILSDKAHENIGVLFRRYFES